jgi:hypothetical protein
MLSAPNAAGGEHLMVSVAALRQFSILSTRCSFHRTIIARARCAHHAVVELEPRAKCEMQSPRF